MSLLDSIGNSIIDGYKISVNTNVFELIESDKGARCKKAKFEKAGGRVLAYKFDKKVTINVKSNKQKAKEKITINSPLPFFKDVEGLKVLPDYIVFYEKDNGKFYIIICNLKSGNKHNCPAQMEAGVNFAKLIMSTVQRVFNEPKKWDYIRKVVFSEKQLYKGFTKATKNIEKNKQVRNYISNEKQVDICDLDVICC